MAPQPLLSATRSFQLSQSRPLVVSNSQSKHTPASKGDSTYFSRQGTELETKVQPAFLNTDGRYIQEGLPDRMIQCQGQPLTSTGVLNGTKGMCQAPRAIAAIHSFNDMAPVLTTEFTRDTDRSEVTWDPTINKRGTRGVFTPGGAPTLTKLQELSASLSPASGAGSTMTTRQTIGDPEVRKSSVDAFFHRSGGSSHLMLQDLSRLGDEMGTKALPGHGNAKLIGGKWKYLTRPTEGEALMTDYYGRCDDKHCDYYGRMYHYLPQ